MKLGCSPDSLRVWCQQAERDRGERGGLTSAEKDRIKELEREVRELRTANEILKKASAYFAAADTRPPVPQMIAFLDDHRGVFGVGPICRVLGIASTPRSAASVIPMTTLWLKASSACSRPRSSSSSALGNPWVKSSEKP
ncbi:hypothetical protein E2979_00050 (plasmid) [Paracoccus yeei]